MVPEGRQSKPYQMSKAAEFIGINKEGLWLQPEGYNPSGSFKDKWHGNSCYPC